MLNWLVRWWRVEVALWVCYWGALRRGDKYSYQYCAEHSLLVSAFWIVALGIPYLLACLFR
ncbi:hypothetical protein SCACP_40410 [Sporomusa carbonis]|uniref:hypothetical protein n=1 Tax=Sporomusa carbonis TaxID=3076075 RepID=UPI003A60CC66